MRALVLTPFRVAATGSPLREGVRNGTTTQETQTISNIASTTRPTGGIRRASQLSTSGGGAVCGCRPAAGGSAAKPAPQNPCIRSNDLSTGHALRVQRLRRPDGRPISAANKQTTTVSVRRTTGAASPLNRAFHVVADG